MLIHLEPRCYNPFAEEVALIDFKIDALGLRLEARSDLVVRRPYPNKHYLVVCRRLGQKAHAGILIGSPRVIEQFSVLTRWLVDDTDEVIHRVHYTVADTQFDSVTEHMSLWGGMRGYESRWPDGPALDRPEPLLAVSQI